jgi:hypothetical protein
MNAEACVAVVGSQQRLSKRVAAAAQAVLPMSERKVAQLRNRTTTLVQKHH